MNRRWRVLCLLAILLANWLSFPTASQAGPVQRVANTTLKMPLSPPTFGFTLTNAFPTLVFTNPLCITSPPGETNRLFIVEKKGRIVVITNLAAPTRTIFMDISASSSVRSAADTAQGEEEGLLGMAFHPGYATNGFFYLFYTGTTTTPAGAGRHEILSRFEVSAGNPNLGNPGSELRLIVQYDEADNHNGGDIHFGPDGYLYVALGDEGGSNDSFGNSQEITNDFFSAILRIDVDKRPGNLAPNPHPAALPALTNYAIPADNPFVGATTFIGNAINPARVRTEFWTVGMRNPWRFSFDPVTEALWVGHVGQDSLEWINILTKGANCGWNYYEGDRVLSTPPAGLQPVMKPILEYGHTNSRNCIIGGLVYRGNRISQLYGSYLYSDYTSGELWALRNSGTNVITNSVLLVNASAHIVSYGTDPSNGDVLMAAVRAGNNSTIERLVYNNTTNGTPLPATLADTGAFTNLNALVSALDPLEPTPGIVPYALNVPFWSDNAIKTRWFSVPATNQTIGFNSNGNWSFPTGTVWIKHFNLETTISDPASARRIETRLLVRNNSGIYGATYRWGNSLTNATLVPEAGLDEPLVIDEGGGILRTQVWHYPSRTECVICHTPQGGYGLGFRTEQLNRDFNYPAGTTNQIAALSEAGYFTTPPASVSNLPALAATTDTSASLELRARSFLAANCSQCHQPGGGAQQAAWDARITTPLGMAGLINATPVNSLGDSNNRVIAPMAPSNSVLLTRLSTRDLGLITSIQMPPLDSNLIDAEGVALVTQWIQSISNSFWIAATPASQTTTAGGSSVDFAVNLVATSDFAETVDITASGLPPGISAVLNPSSLNGSNAATLSISASQSVAPGAYDFEITGSTGNRTNRITATVVVTPGILGAMLWTAGGAGTNWSTVLNWTNVTSGGYGPPGALNDVMFAASGSSPTAGNVSNVVDKSTTLNSLWYRNGANSNHTTKINPGVSLNVTGITNVAGGTGFNAGNFLLLVGTNGSTTPSLNVRITGAGGTLNLSNSAAALVVAQFNTTNKHVGVNLRATLDLSGLDTFRADINRFLIGAMNNGSAGILYLARTNFIRLSGSAPQLDLGENNSNQGDPSLLFLGVTNGIFTDSIATSRAKGTNGSIYFNPAFVAENPVAVFRGADGSSRVGSWTIADLLAANGTPDVTQPVSTNDFRGGTVDALVDALVLGKTTTTTPGIFATSNRVSLGVLNFDAGVFDVNTLTNGLQLGNANAGAASWDTGIGVISVNGGTLRVNDTLVLAQGVASLGPASVHGTITVNNGLLAVNQLMAGNGTSTIAVSNSTFAVSNAMTGSALSRLSLTNAQVRLSINGSAAAANILVTNLVAASVNTIAFDSITNVSSDTTLPLISYGNMTGTVAANFALAPPPGNYAINLIDNPTEKRIDIRIRQGTNPIPQFTGLALTSSDLLFNGSNGAPNWGFYLRATTNVELPMSNWLVLSTNTFDFNGSFFLTNPLDPEFPQRFFRLEMR